MIPHPNDLKALTEAFRAEMDGYNKCDTYGVEGTDRLRKAQIYATLISRFEAPTQPIESLAYVYQEVGA